MYGRVFIILLLRSFYALKLFNIKSWEKKKNKKQNILNAREEKEEFTNQFWNQTQILFIYGIIILHQLH